MEQGCKGIADRIRRQWPEGSNRVWWRLVLVVLAAYAVISIGLLQTPTYQASAVLLVGQDGPTLEYRVPPDPTLFAQAIDSRPVAEEVIRRLKLDTTANELLDRLAVEPVANTTFIRLRYEDTDPQRAKLIANSVGEVVSEFSTHRRSDVRATLWEPAKVPERPTSPHPARNGALVLVVGLSLAVVPRRDGLMEDSKVRVGQALTVVRTRLAARRARDHDGSMPIEAIKEKMVLVALDRCGRLSAVQAAMETGLTVDSVDRILSDLANSGHLEITVEDGKLLYSFWGKHGP